MRWLISADFYTTTSSVLKIHGLSPGTGPGAIHKSHIKTRSVGNLRKLDGRLLR